MCIFWVQLWYIQTYASVPEMIYIALLLNYWSYYPSIDLVIPPLVISGDYPIMADHSWQSPGALQGGEDCWRFNQNYSKLLPLGIKLSHNTLY